MRPSFIYPLTDLLTCILQFRLLNCTIITNYCSLICAWYVYNIANTIRSPTLVRSDQGVSHKHHT